MLCCRVTRAQGKSISTSGVLSTLLLLLSTTFSRAGVMRPTKLLSPICTTCPEEVRWLRDRRTTEAACKLSESVLPQVLLKRIVDQLGSASGQKVVSAMIAERPNIGVSLRHFASGVDRCAGRTALRQDACQMTTRLTRQFRLHVDDPS